MPSSPGDADVHRARRGPPGSARSPARRSRPGRPAIGRIETTSGPDSEPAGRHATSVRYIGTLLPCSMWRTGTPAASSASSKVKLQPIRKATMSSRQRSIDVVDLGDQLAVLVDAVGRQVGAQVAGEPRAAHRARLGDVEDRARRGVALREEQEVVGQVARHGQQVGLGPAGAPARRRHPQPGAEQRAGLGGGEVGGVVGAGRSRSWRCSWRSGWVEGGDETRVKVMRWPGRTCAARGRSAPDDHRDDGVAAGDGVVGEEERRLAGRRHLQGAADHALAGQLVGRATRSSDRPGEAHARRGCCPR